MSDNQGLPSNGELHPQQPDAVMLPPGAMLGGWQPVVALDVFTATQKQFDDKRREFYRLVVDRPLRPDLLSTGWHTIVPEIAEQLLLGKSNRPLRIKTIAYYARQMLDGEWLRNGESLIISEDGVMRDAYHRCWACYLSGASFVTLVATGVPLDPFLFASIDNGLSRTDVDALRAYGENGLSPMLAATAKIAVKYVAGVYEPRSRVVVPRMTPKQMLLYVRAHPSLHEAVNEIVSEHRLVMNDLFSRKKDVLYFAGWQIHDLYSSDVLSDFLAELSDEEPTPGPIALLRNKLLADTDCRANLSKREVLAFVIKAFNAWQGNKTMRRLILGTDEMFPKFDVPNDDDDDEAATSPQSQIDAQPQV
jgi:hypothetical protein